MPCDRRCGNCAGGNTVFYADPVPGNPLVCGCIPEGARCPTQQDWENALRHCQNVRRNKRGCVLETLRNGTGVAVSREMLDFVGIQDASNLSMIISSLDSFPFLDMIPVVGDILDTALDLVPGLGQTPESPLSIPAGTGTQIGTGVPAGLSGVLKNPWIIGGAALLIVAILWRGGK